MDYFLDVKNIALNTALNVVGAIVPTLKESKFLEKGVLTPEEFVIAGDLLVLKCPSWRWCGADEGKFYSILPKNKQYLVTKGVPCFKRVDGLKIDIDEKLTKDGWIDATFNENPYIYNSEDDIEEIVDIEDIDYNLDKFIEDDLKDDLEDDNDYDKNILKTRVYDLSITYDRYYQVPRLLLCGSNEFGTPLDPKQIWEDVMAEYAKRTVSIENHPHVNTSNVYASIHPCKHADIMHILTKNLPNPRVDMYMFYFLKFMSSIIP